MRFADDFIITATSKEILVNEVIPLVKDFLEPRGLQLSEEKSQISHINKGFDFLGQHIRKYSGKLLVVPSKKAIKNFKLRIRKKCRELRGAPQEMLISNLNSITRGWCNFHRHASSKKTFAKLDHWLWTVLWQWARRRHNKKSARWIKNRYFRKVKGFSWTFACDVIDDSGKTMTRRLFRPSETTIRRHTKIKRDANPYEPQHEHYFEQRLMRKMMTQLTGKRKAKSLYKRQEGRCNHCQQILEDKNEWEIHHIIRRVNGGKDTLDNLTLVHVNCHKQIHSSQQTGNRIDVKTGLTGA